MAESLNPNTARTDHPRSRSDEFHPRGINLSQRMNDDEVIASLANARENRRARQVNEWERVGVKSLFRVF